MFVSRVHNLTCDTHSDALHQKCSLIKCILLNKSFVNLCKIPLEVRLHSKVFNIICCLIVFLNFPRNSEAFCPAKCVCEYESLRVQCTNASLDHVPILLSPQLEMLSLPCNNIESVDQSLEFYPDLKKIDLSYNKIKELNVNDFTAQQNLKILNLNRNKLKKIESKSFSPLINLKELHLSHNIIVSIEPESFAYSKEFKILDLSNNKLQSLNSNTFNDENIVESIKLSYNYFLYVPSNALAKIRSLTELDLTGNLISEITEGTFRSFNNLTSLTLDKNNINVLHPNSFEGLTHLRSLSLKDNRLSTIEGSFFRFLGALNTLDLSGNLFEVIESTAFSSLVSLLHMRLTRCPRLYRIDSQAFADLGSLESLQLSHNARLVYLGDSIFSSLTKLRDLDLTACGLIYVHPDQMPRSSATKLHLAGNPFHCNCSLMWLAELPFNDSFYLDAPTCATPPNLYGVPVHKVDLRTAGCNHQLGLAAIGTCIGVVLLGLLIIAIFLAWRWSKRSLKTNKTLPGANERGIREPWGPGQPPPPPPPGPIVFPGAPIYSQKYCIPSQVNSSSCGHTQCQGACQIITQPPYTLHPATHPLLTPPSPSINSQSHLPIDWLYPSPYDEDTHWYTTIGRDGREYLTGEIKREHQTPPPLPPLPQESPSSHLTTLTPSSPASVRLKRGNSFSQSSSSAGHRTPTPILNNRTIPAFTLNEGLTNNDRQRIPVTYI